MALLFDLAERNGTTLLLVTHDAELAASCERILHIHDGRIEADRRGGRREAALA
jgi:putative ABC transport system ATP-binding protein